MEEKKRSTAYCMFVIGSLFFVFGFVTWLNNILIPYMRTSCELTTQVQGYLVTFAFYIAYFVMSIPSSFVLKKTGYSNGMALGLVVMAIGCMMFIPGAKMRSYPMFLLGLFLQGSGLSLLQTASNPYVTVIGPIESAARRMSIMGICNKVAGMIGILVLYNALFSGKEHLFESIKEMAPGPEKEAMLQQLSNGTMSLQLNTQGSYKSKKDEIKETIETRFGYDLSFTLDSIRDTYTFDVSCMGTVPPAIVAFLESTDFVDAIRNAISIGGDSDTIAACTGPIAEAYYGIPAMTRDFAETYLDNRLDEILVAFERAFPGKVI